MKAEQVQGTCGLTGIKILLYKIKRLFPLFTPDLRGYDSRKIGAQSKNSFPFPTVFLRITLTILSVQRPIFKFEN